MVTVLNLENNSRFQHSIVFIEGETHEEQTEITVLLQPSVGNNQQNDSWPVVRSRFKALVELSIGCNEISFILDTNCVKTFNLYYVVPNSQYFLRLLYLVCSDDIYNGQFQGPEDDQHNCVETLAYKKILLGVKLIQTFTSECFYRLGLDRKTFKLELDVNSGRPICHRFVLKGVTTSQAQQLSENQLWNLVKNELSCDDFTRERAETCKFLAFVSFTRYVNEFPTGVWPDAHQEMLSMTKGHCALGGGGLAVMGTGCLHTWPSNLHDVVPCFTDTRTIDRSKLLDDSAYRHTYFACFATTLGATCHELGHTFGLCHTASGIMGRGFDNLHKVFVLSELEQSGKVLLKSSSLENAFVNRIKLKKLMDVEWEGATWTTETALWLYYHKWFNTNLEDHNDRLQYNGADIRSRHGIRVVIVASVNAENASEATVEKFWNFEKGTSPLVFRLPNTSDLSVECKKKLMAIDSLGNMFITAM